MYIADAGIKPSPDIVTVTVGGTRDSGIVCGAGTESWQTGPTFSAQIHSERLPGAVRRQARWRCITPVEGLAMKEISARFQLSLE